MGVFHIELRILLSNNGIRLSDMLFLSDQLSEEGDDSKMPLQQSNAEIYNGLRVVSTRKSAVSTKKGKERNLCI